MKIKADRKKLRVGMPDPGVIEREGGVDRGVIKKASKSPKELEELLLFLCEAVRELTLELGRHRR